MSWDLGLSRTVARLIPTQFRNNIMYQWLSAVTYPLQYINDEFKVFAKQKKIEASLSSQTMLLESYLNGKYESDFSSSNESISIINTISVDDSVATYFESEYDHSVDPTGYVDNNSFSYNESEYDYSTSPTSYIDENLFVYYDYEDFGVIPEDFRLILPVSFQTNESVVRGIQGIVDKYKIDTKKYDTVYSQ